MPVREPKGRYLTREYMADREFMTLFEARERETYLMLAMFADDAGWLDWDPEELAATMYRYEPVDDRVLWVEECAMKFSDTGRMRILKCGHACMPKVGARPRSGSPEYRVRDAHEDRCKSKSSRQKSTRSRSNSDRPPNLTLPNHTNTLPKREGNSNQPTRAPARGGAPLPIGEAIPGELKRRVGWEPKN